jgi:hypothetical protein
MEKIQAWKKTKNALAVFYRDGSQKVEVLPERESELIEIYGKSEVGLIPYHEHIEILKFFKHQEAMNTL